MRSKKGMCWCACQTTLATQTPRGLPWPSVRARVGDGSDFERPGVTREDAAAGGPAVKREVGERTTSP